MFEVVGYENLCIFVRCRSTGETYRFEVGEDGASADSEARADHGETRRVAIEYLFRLRRSALVL